MDNIVLINVYHSGSMEQLFSKYDGMDESSTVTSCSPIQNKVVEQKPNIIFDPDNHIILV